jgi:hypothetical protein
MLGFNHKKSDLAQAIALYLETVPSDAPVRGVLASPPIQQQLGAFDRADLMALRQQKRYGRAGKLARMAAVLGLLIVPIDVLPLHEWLPSWSASW